jgi:hypothetical protein
VVAVTMVQRRAFYRRMIRFHLVFADPERLRRLAAHLS